MSGNRKPVAFLLGALLGLLITAPVHADLELRADGWHRWEVPAGSDAGDACCRHELRGGVTLVGCNLGAGTQGPRPGPGCVTRSETLQVFVEIAAGQARQVHAFGGACPVDTGTPVEDHGEVLTADSLRSLANRLGDDRRVLDGALVAIAAHEDAPAVRMLVDIARDERRQAAVRERALFWLVQSDSDTAWAFLDRLLAPGP